MGEYHKHKECLICMAIVENGDDSSGLCGKCFAHGQQKPVDYTVKRLEIETLLAENKGRRIDVLAAVSGGFDSLYQLHLLKRELNAQVKAFTWDHYHSYITVIKRIRRMIIDLEVIEWTTVGLRFDVSSKLMKSFFCTVKRFCICPHFMLLRALPLAISEEIPLIAIGYSPDQNERKGCYQLPEKNRRLENLIEWSKSFKALVLYCLERVFPDESNELADYLFHPLTKAIEYLKLKGGTAPAILQLSPYFPWSEKRSVLAKHYGWAKSEKIKLHNNCLFEPVRGYMEYIMDRPFLIEEANFLIRSGELTKEEAREGLARMNVASNQPKVLGEYLRYANMSMKDFHRELEQPMTDEATDLLYNYLKKLFAFQGFDEKAIGPLIR
ncbi:MAG: hypothetical protein JRD93_02575 [Deltaproteobacteria bacterium]|nr:hypothetical protein [Deltaproteobacteria bacterium]